MNFITSLVQMASSLFFGFSTKKKLFRTCFTDVKSPVNYSKIRVKEGCSLAIGIDSLIETQIVFERVGASLQIGERTFIGMGLLAVATHISIGNDVLIAWGVTITDHNSHSLKFSERAEDVIKWKKGEKDWAKVQMGQVQIQDKAWIGFNSLILKNVTIGEGAIIGAGSVVTKDVSPWTIVAGNPAKIIREIPLEER